MSSGDFCCIRTVDLLWLVGDASGGEKEAKVAVLESGALLGEPCPLVGVDICASQGVSEEDQLLILYHNE